MAASSAAVPVSASFCATAVKSTLLKSRRVSTLANVGLDYIHITEFEAWRPAFGDDGPSLVSLARESAPGLTIMANGELHNPDRAAQMFSIGADLIALGRGALANPAWPRQTANGSAVHSFNPTMLSPLGDIKPSELS